MVAVTCASSESICKIGGWICDVCFSRKHCPPGDNNKEENDDLEDGENLCMRVRKLHAMITQVR